MSLLGKACPVSRQILTTPQVGLARQEKVIELPLFPPGGVALVFAKLAIP